MPLSPAGLYKIILNGEIHGQPTQNAFHFQTRSYSASESYMDEAQGLLDDFILFVLPEIQNFANTEWHVKSIILSTLIPAHAILLEVRPPTGSGTQTDDSLPSFCAGVLSLRTGQGGRRSHGRLYLAGISEGLSEQSRLNGQQLALLSTIGTLLVARYGVGGSYPFCSYGVFSRADGVTRVATPTPHLVYSHDGFKPIRNIIARRDIKTMRKRMILGNQ